jgi:hypothetical protein
MPMRRINPLWRWALLVTLMAACVQVTGADHIRDTNWNDTYRYVNMTERDMGRSPAQAEHAALEFYCAGPATTTGMTGTARCVSYWTAKGGLAPDAPQYNAIFYARPGYPAAAVPFTEALGLDHGLAALTLLITIAAGWGVLLLLWASGLSRRASLGGMIALYTFPTWYWLGQFLTDGPALMLTIWVLAGAAMMLNATSRRQVRCGTAVLSAAYALGFLVRWSSFAILALCFLPALAILSWRHPRWRTRRVALLAAVNGTALTLLTTIPAVAGWPGLNASVTDTFTGHFTQKAPANLYGKLLKLNVHSWTILLTRNYLSGPLLPALCTLGLKLLLHYHPDLAALVTAAALTGLGTAAAHPLASQMPRLYLSVYLLGICGLPVLLDHTQPGNTRASSHPPPALCLGLASNQITHSNEPAINSTQNTAICTP